CARRYYGYDEGYYFDYW
nr:immunoglobulin heavy chain junction region [Mus musculus]MBK4186553.1 immunoglobulin heavy chain junction region [Mus musculus]